MRKSHLSKGLCLITLIFFISTNIYAWNQNGHIVISEISYRKLSKDLQEKVTEQLLPFFKARKNTNNLSVLSKLSYYPDLWHDLTFQEITEKYKIEIPEELIYLKDSQTKYWHFNDKYIGPGSLTDSCKLMEYKENSVKITKKFIDLYPKIHDQRMQGLMLIFIIHMIEDIHQPLHGMSYISKECGNDYGGNKFCLDKFCNNNLHAYWDSGSHLFYDPHNIPEMVDGLSKSFRLDNNLFKLSDVNDWNEEDLIFSNFIYNTPENDEPDPSYRKKSQSIVRRRVLEASERLTKVLKMLLNPDSTNAMAQK